MKRYTIDELIGIIEEDFQVYDVGEIVEVLTIIKRFDTNKNSKTKEPTWKKWWKRNKSYQRQSD